MDLKLDYTDKQLVKKNVKISGSKSESNRLLILQQLFKQLTIQNLSDSDDTRTMQEILASNNAIADVHHAGTAMRFLTAFFAVKKDYEVLLTGSSRMQERPIKILVDALLDLGADIEYEKKEGYPPLRIKGKELQKSKVTINGNVSSQYLSALLLIAPGLKEGLELELIGEITSRPYLEMTLELLNQLGVKHEWNDAIITVFPINTIEKVTITVESDWSSASYYYSLVALSSEGAKISLTSYNEDSLQGDSCLAEIYRLFGVSTSFEGTKITLQKTKNTPPSDKVIQLDLKNAPDIAQTIAVTCFGLGLACELTGLHTLKIKETDRLVALKVELEKLGAEVSITNETLNLRRRMIVNENISIATYNDHRMAMAFAPLALKVPITIKDSEVVTKSYLMFWNDFKSLFSS